MCLTYSRIMMARITVSLYTQIHTLPFSPTLLQTNIKRFSWWYYDYGFLGCNAVRQVRKYVRDLLSLPATLQKEAADCLQFQYCKTVLQIRSEMKHAG